MLNAILGLGSILIYLGGWLSNPKEVISKETSLPTRISSTLWSYLFKTNSYVTPNAVRLASLVWIWFISITPDFFPELQTYFTPQIVIGFIILAILIREVPDTKLEIISWAIVGGFILLSIINRNQVPWELRSIFASNILATVAALFIVATLVNNKINFLQVPIMICLIMIASVVEIQVPANPQFQAIATFSKNLSAEVVKMSVIFYGVSRLFDRVENINLRRPFYRTWSGCFRTTLILPIVLFFLFSFAIIALYEVPARRIFFGEVSVAIAMIVIAIFLGSILKQINNVQTKYFIYGVYATILIGIIIVNPDVLVSELQRNFILSTAFAFIIESGIEYIESLGKRRVPIMLTSGFLLLLVIHITTFSNSIDTITNEISTTLSIILEISISVGSIYFFLQPDSESI